NTIGENTGAAHTTDKPKERNEPRLVPSYGIGFKRGKQSRTRSGDSMPVKTMKMGLIVGNRGFFPDHLAKSGRDEMLRVLSAAGMDVVALTPEESKYGAVETREESRRCAELFKKNRDRIEGVIVTLPNFGEERAIADTLRLADL